MQLADFTGKPCRSRMAYEFLPKKSINVNLEKASVELAGIAKTEVSSKVLLMVRIEHCTASLFPSGKLLIRGERDEEKAKALAGKILGAIKESIKY